MVMYNVDKGTTSTENVDAKLTSLNSRGRVFDPVYFSGQAAQDHLQEIYAGFATAVTNQFDEDQILANAVVAMMTALGKRMVAQDKEAAASAQ